MLKIYQRSALFTFFLLCFAVFQLEGQSGSVSGTVYDTDGKTTLPGASVYLKNNLSAGTASDFDGTFILINIPVGPQTISVSYTGYKTTEITVEVVAGAIATFEAVLPASVYSGETILVTAQALGQAKAINQQLNSDAIANFVSADKIKELPDVNAAEAISRLPGVAINRSGGEGSKVVVRGLDPKFTAISINGVRLPSTSGTDRSVDLSLISPELLSGIELFKSPTADMDGDALGGSINLNIIKAPKEAKASIKVLGGYNDITGTLQDYKATASVARRVFGGKLGITATGNIERFNRSGESINQSWGDDLGVLLDTAQNIFAQRGNNLRFQERLEIRQRQNGSLGLDFTPSKKTDVSILGIYSRTSRDQFIQTENYDPNNNRVQYTGEIRESSIDLFSGSISTRHKLNNLNIEWGAAYSKVTGKTPNNFDILFRNDVQPIFDSEVRERRDFPEEFYDYLTVNPEGDFLQQASSSASGNSEAIGTGFVNLELPFQVADNIRATFKVGGKVTSTNKNRNFQERFGRLLYLVENARFADFVDEGAPASAVDPSGNFYYGMSNFLQDEVLGFTRENGEEVDLLTNINPDKIRRFQELYGEDLLRNSRYGINNNYDLTENVYAGFVQLKLKFGDQLTAIPGFRYEYSDNRYAGNLAILSGDFGENGSVDREEKEVNYGIPLPHLHLKYKPKDWLDVRASFSTTLARPDYNYVVPSTLINVSNDVQINQGNADLAAAVSTNYDLFVTAFSGKWGLLSGGVFYKDIQNAFYPIFLQLNSDSLISAYNLDRIEGDIGGAELSTYSNSAGSVVKGFEIELQTNLNFLPAPFNGLVANFNYTRLNSETTINSFTEVITIDPITFTPVVEVVPFQREVALVGQARDIFNASLGYDHKRTFSARVSASYQGDKISGYSSGATKDRFNQGFWRFDAAFKKKFKSGLNLFLNLNNLSNQTDINFYTSLDRVTRESRDFVTSRTRYGATATFGAEYKF
jgi:TonB-dependent receptor